MWPFSHPYPPPVAQYLSDFSEAECDSFDSPCRPDHRPQGMQLSIKALPRAFDPSRSASPAGIGGRPIGCLNPAFDRLITPARSKTAAPMDRGRSHCVEPDAPGRHHPQGRAAPSHGQKGSPTTLEVRLCPLRFANLARKRASSASCSANLTLQDLDAGLQLTHRGRKR